jgi:hypothetical protein
MQESQTKRQHHCLSSCDTKYATLFHETVTNDDEYKLPWMCFRLPFCDVKHKEKNRVHEILISHDQSCFHCGERTQTKSDDDDDDDDDDKNDFIFRKIHPFIHFDSASRTKQRPTHHISYSNEESSTTTTADATNASTGTSAISRIASRECDIPTTEIRYISLDSLFKPSRRDDTITTEVSSAEFSFDSDSQQRATIDTHCICCQVTLFPHWKYCPSCGIYLDRETSG